MLLERLRNNGIPELKLNDVQKSAITKIEGKIQAGEYAFETLEECPICNHDQFDQIGEKDRYGLYYPVSLCTSCGLMFTNPRMNQESYNDFYNDQYRNLYGGDTGAPLRFFENQESRGKKIYKFLDMEGDSSSSQQFILEVGCGAGGILNYFKNQGHTVLGFDLGEKYIEFGKTQYDLNLKMGTLATVALEQKPDVIIYSHVMEHILDLDTELRLIKKISKPSTKIYIEVPGVKNIPKAFQSNILRYFQNAHTFHFTLTSLRNLFSKHGFKFVKGDEFVHALFVNSTENGTRAKSTSEYDAIITYLVSLEKRRKLDFLTPNSLKIRVKRGVLSTLDMLGLRKYARKLNRKINSLD